MQVSPVIQGVLRCGAQRIDLREPKVMGVLNVTPDSFYDGGQHYSATASGSKLLVDRALLSAEAMLGQGATIIDIGGESTRPGAAPVTEQQELDRVVPVVEAIAANLDVVISIDTSTAQVITEAASAGAGLINDVRALERPGALAAAVASGLPICLMHMQGGPQTMQENPSYQDVVTEVGDYLRARIAAVHEASVGSSPQLLLDPGFGFGKTDEHNLELMRRLSELAELGYPLLIGVSRKSMIGRLLGRQPEQRLAGSLALAYAALVNGAKIIRAHDVAETRDIVKIFNCVMNK